MDIEGLLTDEPGTQCFIEVKATRGDGSNPFFMSESQWEMANWVHQTRVLPAEVGDAAAVLPEASGDLRNTAVGEKWQFVVLRVANVMSKDIEPRLAYILLDPIDLLSRGHISLGTREKLQVTYKQPSKFSGPITSSGFLKRGN